MMFGIGEITLILIFNACICLLLPRILTFNWARIVKISSDEINS
jgi:hypothetical protein